MASTKPEQIKKNKRETKAEDKVKAKKTEKPKVPPKGKYSTALKPGLSDACFSSD
jgi:hypothetical protein